MRGVNPEQSFKTQYLLTDLRVRIPPPSNCLLAGPHLPLQQQIRPDKMSLLCVYCEAQPLTTTRMNQQIPQLDSFFFFFFLTTESLVYCKSVQSGRIIEFPIVTDRNYLHPSSLSSSSCTYYIAKRCTHTISFCGLSHQMGFFLLCRSATCSRLQLQASTRL